MKLQLPIFFIILGLTSINGEAESEINLIKNDADSNELKVSRRIFGGTTANINLFPFVAKLNVIYKTGATQMCSGVVLTSRVIITVAHCVQSHEGKRAQLVIATLPMGGLYTFKETEIIIHPAYRSTYYGADVAVLRKDSFSTYMKNFEPAPCLPPQEITVPEGFAIIAGWGKNGKSPLLTTRLQVAIVNIMDATECATIYNDAEQNMYDNELICTMHNVAGLCEGDWGGPLIVFKNGVAVLQGLNLFRGGSCCGNKENFPSAYFNLETVADWLRHIGKELRVASC